MNEDRLSELIRESDHVPESPDCRAAVMERIRTSDHRRSFAWAYALAAILAALATTWAFIPRAQRHNPVVNVVKRAHSEPKQIAERTPLTPEVHRKPATRQLPDAPKPRRRYFVRLSPRPTPRPDNAVAVAEPTPDVKKAPVEIIPANDRPIAIAIVKWPSKEEQDSDTYSYGYTNRDVRTGQTTECRVKRSGDSVEIYMESKPEANTPPMKGSIGYETKPSV